MLVDRRTALVTLTGGAAAATLGSAPAEALLPARTTSILLFNRSTGAWLVQVPAGLDVAGARYGGTNAARFAGRTGAVGVIRRYAPAGGAAVNGFGVLTFRGSATVTPSWEVIGFDRPSWARRAGGNLAFAGASWIPTGWLLDDDSHVTMIGAQQSAYLRLDKTGAARTAWALRTRGVQRLVQPVDTAYAMAAQGAAICFGMGRGGTLAEFRNANAGTDRAPSLRVVTTLGTIRGHVYGPVVNGVGSVLMVYDRRSGLAQFVRLGAGTRLAGASVVFALQIGAGWTHVVPFRYGWYLYDRTRRSAQMVTIEPYFLSGGSYRVRFGTSWAAGSLPDFTDAVGFA